jgi:hypothetical protein
MQKALSLPNVHLFESQPVDEELLYRIHTHRYLQDVKRAWYYKGAIRTCSMSASVITATQSKTGQK